MKNLRLNKDQINDIKYFIKQEVKQHEFGSWDRFRLTSVKIHADGYYSFKVNWMCGYGGIRDDYWMEGNLFDEFPIYAVLDGLDAVKLLFYKIHIKACERLKNRANRMIEEYHDEHEYLKQIYKPGRSYNVECKNIE